MAIGRAKQIAFTKVGDFTAPTSTITRINSYTVTDNDELAAFLDGTARVDQHFASKKSASIQVVTADPAAFFGFAVGQTFSSVILTVEGAVSSAGVGASDYTVTLSKAVISELGEVTKGNEDSAPVTRAITFQLSRHIGDSADPTVVAAVVGGG
jgi:hypothetical protein